MHAGVIFDDACVCLRQTPASKEEPINVLTDKRKQSESCALKTWTDGGREWFHEWNHRLTMEGLKAMEVGRMEW